MARSANRPPPNEIRTRRNSSMRQASDDILESDLTSSTRSVSYSSDKENHASSARRTNGSTKRMSQLPTPSSLETSASNSNKRRKLGERGGYEPSQAAARLFYDPEQPMDERRAVRKNYRDLSRELAGTYWLLAIVNLRPALIPTRFPRGLPCTEIYRPSGHYQ